ncbi:TraB/GumN family protein [Virgibacillus sp. AGTR]|uniref:TraB/GumN family protein n=1 Tax=Virgibacillus salarius TaxID=447199 RepID=A0A941IA04_9BACI|nr:MULTISPECIES: TraB/GumN family protein [Virgibacillus]NAZ07632.1 TraB family protein [Agaribacter marinus]MBR7794912.1 TraB/GumN family protein [Virgibacillus salarius]MCC2249407.1 TraB/GumN family protein [Virgibacillus sp. AGTR]MDY7045025.1 TraB/GumN family protein [Virgibacillus sp. M23]QRZ18802.1 TraB/GumN family protein [Virgibacillus sp. AGTR]
MTEENITRIHIGNKEYILIGTAHVSKHSAEQVKNVIEAEKPDAVCVELDEQRFQSVQDGNSWREMDIFKVIKEKKATLLLMNLAISSFQKRMAKQFGINPGQEMIQGIKSAEENDAKLVLADRNIQITFSRIWHNIGLKGKAILLTQVIASIFSRESISEEELEKMKTQDTINTILQEFTDTFPKLKEPLIDERDQYLAQKIKDAPGNKVVAVLGAAHVPGIKEEIKREHNLQKLAEIPPKSKIPKIIGWSIPVLILAIIAYTFFANPAAGWEQTLSWVIWNGSLSAIGALIAFGHPLTILTAFLVAPLTSLNPLLAAGWFAGFVQAYIRRPHVRDFETLSEDVFTVKGFWRNKVTRVLLIVVLANLGSSLGTFIGGVDVIRVFLENL